MLASRITHTHSGASRVGYISILGSPVNGGDPEGGVDRDTAEGAAGPRTPADPLRTRNGASATRPASVLHPIRAPVVGALPQPWSRRGALEENRVLCHGSPGRTKRGTPACPGCADSGPAHEGAGKGFNWR